MQQGTAGRMAASAPSPSSAESDSAAFAFAAKASREHPSFRQSPYFRSDHGSVHVFEPTANAHAIYSGSKNSGFVGSAADEDMQTQPSYPDNVHAAGVALQQKSDGYKAQAQVSTSQLFLSFFLSFFLFFFFSCICLY